VTVGDPVDSDQPTNIVAAQNPSGSAPGGTTITINPSNGQATGIPNVQGQELPAALQQLQAAGFTNLAPACTVDAGAQGNQQKVTGTNPPAGTVAGRGTAISVAYTAKSC
jgi:beta-lactam-binding protein with PASTA domain